MPSTQEFRRRIKSVNNTKQITKAMEMVASVKMQKSIKTILEARTYVQDSWNMLAHLAHLILEENHPLLNPGKTNKTAIIFVSSDRGLCGSYNSDLYKKLTAFCADIKKKAVAPDPVEDPQKADSRLHGIGKGSIDIIAIGRKGAEFVRRRGIGNLVAVYDGFDSNICFEDIIPISKMTNGEYLNGQYSKVVVIYAHFASSLKQIPVVKQILPINRVHIDLPEIWRTHDPEKDSLEYKIEPDPGAVIEKLLRRFVRLQVYGAVLEANASEHSSRMVAMKNATDNAGNLIGELTLTYNTIRQNGITSEIAEISGAAEAMK